MPNTAQTNMDTEVRRLEMDKSSIGAWVDLTSLSTPLVSVEFFPLFRPTLWTRTVTGTAQPFLFVFVRWKGDEIKNGLFMQCHINASFTLS